MTSKQMVVVVMVVVTTLTASAFEKKARVIETQPSLRPVLESICQEVERVVSASEFERVEKSDRATVLVATLGETDAGLERFFHQIGSLPPDDRLPAIKASISKAIGRKWRCAKFDDVWNMK